MKKFKIIFFTFLVFCISAFSYFPKSYSKYIKEEEPVKFHVGIDKLYIGELSLLAPRSTSTYKEVNYVVEFDRSQVMKDGDESQEIVVYIEQDVCEITNISADAYIGINRNVGVVTYDHAYNDHVVVSYKCNVSDITVNENGTDLLYTNVYIYEKFMPENIQYLYAKSSGIKVPLSDYYVNYPKPVGEISDDYKQLTLHVDTDDKYAEFIAWINLYSSSLNGEYVDEINTYINSMYTSEDDILKLDRDLKGISVIFDSENNNYIFTIDNNFIGCVKTYYQYIGPKALIKMAFSNNNLTDEENNELVRYYLESYSEYTMEEIDKIMLYIENYGSLNYIMNPNSDGTYNEILGFTYLKDSNEIRINSSILSYVDSFFTKRISVEFADRPKMFNLLLNSLLVTYDFITDDLYQVISTDINIYTSIGKNNTSVIDKIEYSDYFTIQDPVTKEYILVNIYSDGVSHTYVEIIDLGLAEALTLLKTETGFDVSMTVDNQDSVVAKENVTEIVGNIDEYFETSYKNEIVDDLFTSSTTIGNITSLIEENNITISYSMTN